MKPTLHDYQMSGEAARMFGFDALIMAAMRKADSINFAVLATAFPEIAATLQARYDAPGGRLEVMRTEKEVKEFLESIMRDETLTTEQRKIMGRTLRWVLGLEDKVIL